MSMPMMEKFKRLDVRPVLARGGEPYGLIRSRVDALGEGDGLVLVAPFLPAPLVEKLGAEGFRSKVERGASGEWIVYFWRGTE
jgi:uncharacterized protein (DUF2249 family)